MPYFLIEMIKSDSKIISTVTKIQLIILNYVNEVFFWTV